MEFFYAYLVIINAIGFLFMLIDKQKAKRKRWRIPERTLMTIAAIGGSVGCWVGMYLFRHKTKHLKFSLGIPIMISVQILAAVLIFIIATSLGG